MFETLKNAFKVKDIRRKLLITLFLLVVFRIGSWLPIPGVKGSYYGSGVELMQNNALLGLISAISGGALATGAFLSLGIAPYINASIIFQLLAVAIPYLERLSKQGEEGKRKLNQLTRYGTLVLALAQSIGVAINWNTQGFLMTDLFGAGTNLPWVVGTFVVVILVTGSMFAMWLGEKITELGVGNGISLLIFVGIIATAGQRIIITFQEVFGIQKASGAAQNTFGDSVSINAMWQLIIFAIMVIVIFLFIIFIDLAERRVTIQYAKQVKGRKMYGGQSSHIPIKVNANGVLPIIFSSALTSFPQVIFSFIGTDIASATGFVGFYRDYLMPTGQYNYPYFIITAILIFLFSFFYAQIQFNPEEVSRNIQQYGGFIPGIRPGKPTTDYLSKISRRLTFFGAFFLAIIALVPSIIFKALLPGSVLTDAFSATGLLIVVSIALEIQKQLEGQLMMKHYKGFLK
ncbi:MAG: preprotein translocase subunit SecY [Clostridiales bacterium]|jgi:preprotein translocase subunit SecY|nr:preprotein translocase subunit SecY [Clostridiales bacterium]